MDFDEFVQGVKKWYRDFQRDLRKKRVEMRKEMARKEEQFKRRVAEAPTENLKRKLEQLEKQENKSLGTMKMMNIIKTELRNRK